MDHRQGMSDNKIDAADAPGGRQLECSMLHGTVSRRHIIDVQIRLFPDAWVFRAGLSLRGFAGCVRTPGTACATVSVATGMFVSRVFYRTPGSHYSRLFAIGFDFSIGERTFDLKFVERLLLTSHHRKTNWLLLTDPVNLLMSCLLPARIDFTANCATFATVRDARARKFSPGRNKR